MRYWAILLLVGCGDGHGGSCEGFAAANQASCHSFTACGGNPQGTWNYAGACGVSATNPFAGVCPEATWSVGDPDYTGTVKFNADTSWAYDLSGSQSACFSLPASCLKNTNITSCQDLQTALQSAMSPNGTVMASCGGSTSSSCACTFTISQTLHQTGTWQVSGSNVLVTTQSGPSTNPFCVSAHELDVENPQFSGDYILFSR
jgi:hypothetical protein